ncbi:TMEM175 family protein [Sphingomonas sp.]|uniref:TMEM175 family protein n=1 Tax=Sphingomonas sp. TaxID=28214 RepID=UPI0025FB276E|nr:TMEM175 family protein [Sphingomonas sp.]
MRTTAIGKGRIEAFSDGVIAIIITIMVLELKVPHETEFLDLLPALPVLSSYVLSFVYVGIYWNNHHHMFHVAKGVSGAIMWANLHLLFWLSLIPFVTHWMGENFHATAPVASYGFILMMTAIAYGMLASLLARHDGAHSVLAKAMGKDRKGNVSIMLYLAGIAFSFISTPVALAIYVGTAIVWLVPDRRVERALAEVTSVKPGGNAL